MPAERYDFNATLQVDKRTGELLSAYFRIRDGKVAVTKEYEEGVVYADYDAKGRLLGIELLGPCEFRVLDKITRTDRIARNFVHEKVPHELVPA